MLPVGQGACLALDEIAAVAGHAWGALLPVAQVAESGRARPAALVPRWCQAAESVWKQAMSEVLGHVRVVMKPQQLMMMVVPDGELDQQSLPHRCASAPGLERTETRERRVSCLLGQPGGAACQREPDEEATGRAVAEVAKEETADWPRAHVRLVAPRGGGTRRPKEVVTSQRAPMSHALQEQQPCGPQQAQHAPRSAGG